MQLAYKKQMCGNIATIKIMNASPSAPKFPCAPLHSFPPALLCLYPSPLLHPQANTSLLSESTDSFAFSRILYKWNHICLYFFFLSNFFHLA